MTTSCSVEKSGNGRTGSKGLQARKGIRRIQAVAAVVTDAVSASCS